MRGSANARSTCVRGTPSATSLSLSHPQPRSPVSSGWAVDRAAGARVARRARGACLAHARKPPASTITPIAASSRRPVLALTPEHRDGFDASMRPPLTASLLVVATLALLQLPDARAARGDLPTVASHARRCERISRRLQAQERRTVARGTCTTLEGCTPRQRRRWARIAERLADDCVALNQVQVLGTHNSYHIQPRPALLAALLAFSPTFSSIEYTHVPLPQQFDEQGIRQIEIDVFADPMGGLYAHREGLAVIGQNPDSGIPALSQPGFKVLHLQDIDFETTCLTFVDCLQQVKSWSDAHPGHLPIMILVEAKDDLLPPVLDFTIPVPIGVPEFAALDAEIRSVFPPEQLITPDDIRRGRPTL